MRARSCVVRSPPRTRVRRDRRSPPMRSVCCLSADPQRDRDLSRPRRHRDPGQGSAHRGRGQRCLQIALMGSLAQVGLALATSVGAWLNLGLVVWLAARAGHLAFDAALRSVVGKLVAAGLALALVLFLAQGPVARLFAGSSLWHDVATLAVLALIGAIVYGGIVLALFGRGWLAMLRARKR